MSPLSNDFCLREKNYSLWNSLLVAPTAVAYGPRAKLCHISSKPRHFGYIEEYILLQRVRSSVGNNSILYLRKTLTTFSWSLFLYILKLPKSKNGPAQREKSFLVLAGAVIGSVGVST